MGRIPDYTPEPHGLDGTRELSAFEVLLMKVSQQ